MHAVQPVIGGHDAGHACFPNRSLEGAQIEFAQRLLVDRRIDRPALVFTFIADEMLDRRADAARLNAVDEGDGHARRQMRILGEILEIAAVEGIAVHVDGRCQDDMRLLGTHFLGQINANLAHQIGVPCGGQRHFRRIGGRAGALTKLRRARHWCRPSP